MLATRCCPRFASSRQFGFETWSSTPGTGPLQYGYEDIDVSLVGLPEEEDWIIQGPFLDGTLVQNVFTYNTARATGMYAARTRYCVLSIDGIFKGVYVLMEKLKRGPDRIDVSLNNASSDLSGGWIVKLDKGSNNFRTRQRTAFQFDYPASTDITAAQDVYIRGYINDFEAALMARSPNYAGWIDIDSFAHYLLLTELSINRDGYRISMWFYKDKGGRLKAGPVWDYNLAYSAHSSFNPAARTEWVYQGNLTGIPFWWSVLIEEQSFQQAVQSCWTAMRGSVLAVESVNARIDGYVDVMGDLAIDADRDLWRTRNRHSQKIQSLKDEIADRLQWMDEQIAALRPSWGVPSPPGTPTVPPTASPSPLHLANALLNSFSGCPAAEGQSYIMTAEDCALAAALVLGDGYRSVRVVRRTSKLPGCYWRPRLDDVTFNTGGSTTTSWGGRGASASKYSICLS